MHPWVSACTQVAESCLTPEECARQKAFVLRQALFWPSMGVDVFLLKDLDTDPPVGADASPATVAMAAAAAAAGPVPAKERALYSPMYLFNAAEVMQRGWATPRPEPWGLVTHLVGFGDAWGKARCPRLAVPGVVAPVAVCCSDPPTTTLDFYLLTTNCFHGSL